MRHIVFAILVALPTALITWVITRGVMGQPGSRCASAIKEEAAASPADPDAALKAILAAPIDGFSITGEVALYDDKGLFDYIDGAAPLYNERGFRKLAAAEMTVSSGGELTCDVYDMATPENAASIYEAESTPQAKAAPLGDQARVSTMSLVFRKGPYYAKLTAFDADAEAALPKLASALLERMK